MRTILVLVLILSTQLCTYAQKGTEKAIVELKYGHELAEDSTTLTFDYAYFPKPKKVYMDTVNRKLMRYFSGLCFLAEVGPFQIPTKQIVFHYLEDFKRQNLEAYDDEYFQLWSIDAGVYFTETKKTLTIVCSDYSYAGGAHPNGYLTYEHIDKKTAKTLHLGDFFEDIPALTKIAEKYFRETRELAPNDDLEEAGFWFENGVFQLNDNFIFEEDKLIFFYNNYEITSYAAGPTEVVIPIEEVKSARIKRK